MNEDGRSRNMHYKLALNYSIGPKSTTAFEVQAELTAVPGVRYVVQTEVSTPKYEEKEQTREREREREREKETAGLQIIVPSSS